MPKYPKEDVPGDAVATARQVTEYWYKIGQGVGDIDRYLSIGHADQPELYELRIKCDAADDQGYLVVAKGLGEDGYVVAFHRGETVVEAVTGVAARLKNHTLKWREDVYGGNK